MYLNLILFCFVILIKLLKNITFWFFNITRCIRKSIPFSENLYNTEQAFKIRKYEDEILCPACGNRRANFDFFSGIFLFSRNRPHFEKSGDLFSFMCVIIVCLIFPIYFI